MGEVMKCLRENGLDENTLVIFTSDLGPAIKFTPNNGGSAGHLRGGKGSGWEGGFRVPGIFRLPADIPAGSVCMEIGTQLDLLPTIASLCGAKVPGDRPIDGVNLMPVLTGKQQSAAANSPITGAAGWRRCAKAATRPIFEVPGRLVYPDALPAGYVTGRTADFRPGPGPGREAEHRSQTSGTGGEIHAAAPEIHARGEHRAFDQRRTSVRVAQHLRRRVSRKLQTKK